ncbi:MAG: hypothetical protein BWZ01_02499 [Deltaproteobacteria bacterium ADurb.BinA179]|nr:MAG: hypothetical protein BWZ01_02499 [Deltaproteobacteria bacterium ADurb.BinA179]
MQDALVGKVDSLGLRKGKGLALDHRNTLLTDKPLWFRLSFLIHDIGLGECRVITPVHFLFHCQPVTELTLSKILLRLKVLCLRLRCPPGGN